MKEQVYREYGSMLSLIGVVMLLIYTIVAIYLWEHPIIPYGFHSDPRTAIIFVFLPLGLFLTFWGVIIRNIFGEKSKFLTKDGELIHSVISWYKSSESGLYLTSCGQMVSINQDSEETTHVGYKIISAERITCRDCAIKKGRAILERASYGRREY